MDDEPTTATSTIMTALSTLSPPQLTALTHSILADVHRRQLRTAAVLSSPSLFSLTLRHLLSLSLRLKSLLIARLLLSSLRLLTSHLLPLPNPSVLHLRLRDLDAASLLLLLCDLRHRDPLALESSPPYQWRMILRKYCSENALSLDGIGDHGGGGVLAQYVETVVRCRNFVGSIECFPLTEEGRERAAAAATVVALPSVEARGDGGECAICREEMEAGRDVCELPCEHQFHWMCILPWLRKRNTCPCCRLELPTDDVLGEIRRLWNVLVKIGRSGSSSGSCTPTASIGDRH